MEGVTVLNQYINDTVFWIMLAIFGIGIAGILTRYTYNSKHSDILFYFFYRIDFIRFVWFNN